MANYDDKTKDELLDEARERGLEGYSQLNKPELKALLEQDDVNSDVALQQGVSEEAAKEYQEEYVPERQKEVEEAAEEGYDLNEPGYQSEASDPDNPIVAEKLEDNEAYSDLSDEEKELADLALDASGPLHVQSPYERVAQGAVSEEQAKEQEEERAKLPENYVGDVPERVSDELVERAERALDPEKQLQYEQDAADRLTEDQPVSLSEHYDALEQRKDALHERDVNRLQAAEADEEDRAIHETQGHEGQPVDYTKVFQQRAQLDTTGLGGPGAGRIDRAFRTPSLRSGIFHQTFNSERPRDAEILQAERDRVEDSSSDSE